MELSMLVIRAPINNRFTDILTLLLDLYFYYYTPWVWEYDMTMATLLLLIDFIMVFRNLHQVECSLQHAVGKNGTTI